MSAAGVAIGVTGLVPALYATAKRDMGDCTGGGGGALAWRPRAAHISGVRRVVSQVLLRAGG